MKVAFLAVFALAAALSCRAEDPQLLRIKAKLLVEQAGEMFEEASRKDADTHKAPYRYYLGLMYFCGTNLLARPVNSDSNRTLQKYMKLVEKDYDAYTKTRAAKGKAAATEAYSGHTGSRQRASRMISADRLRDRELQSAIKRWEDFTTQIRKSR